MEVGNFSMILRWEWKHFTWGYQSLNGSPFISPHHYKNLIILREPWTIPYIKYVPGPKIHYIESGVNTYSIFIELEEEPCAQADLGWDQIWYMQFDGASSIEGSGVYMI